MDKKMPEKFSVAKVQEPQSTSSLMSMEEALAALIQRNEELISLNQSKDEFIAITSHQLRTPATGVKQYLALLLEGYAEPLTPSQEMFIKKAYENNERQLHIVDDILKVAQLDLDKIKLSPEVYDMRHIIRVATESLQGKFQKKQQIIKCVLPDHPVLAKVDTEEFRLVIENMIENASNYTPEGKKIIIKLDTSKSGEVRIAIKDQGVGIEKQDMAKLFHKFSRINNPLSNAVNGTGLGLYFSKKIVELHGGKINVRSIHEKGTTFTIHLPAGN